jgi:hypothetical protein
LKYVGALWSGLAYLSRYNSGWFCHNNLRRTFSNPSNGKKNKSTDKEPEEDDHGDKSHSTKFQDASKTINVMSGGDEEFSSRREQKLLLREIISVEPVVPRPLRWSEIPISFS